MEKRNSRTAWGVLALRCSASAMATKAAPSARAGIQ